MVLVDVVGLRGEGGDRSVDRAGADLVLELDDVLAIDERSAAGRNERSRAITLSDDRGGGHSQGQESEESSRTHFE